MNYLMEFFASKQVKRFAWTTLAGFLGLAVVYIGNLDFWWVPVVTAIVAGITKELNTYLSE